jgi:hypothetical protein
MPHRGSTRPRSSTPSGGRSCAHVRGACTRGACNLDVPKSTLLGCEIQPVRWSLRGCEARKARLEHEPAVPRGYTSSPNWRIRPLSHPSGGGDSREPSFEPQPSPASQSHVEGRRLRREPCPSCLLVRRRVSNHVSEQPKDHVVQRLLDRGRNGERAAKREVRKRR